MNNRIIVLNVGVNVGGVPTHSPKDIFLALYEVASLRAYAYNVAQSPTEATVAILCVVEDVEKALAGIGGHLCADLKQDCISVWGVESGRHLSAEGWLVGPNAAAWGGQFDATQFYDLDGKPLANRVVTKDASADLYASRGTDDNGEPLV
jgi:hypothetical protein